MRHCITFVSIMCSNTDAYLFLRLKICPRRTCVVSSLNLSGAQPLDRRVLPYRTYCLIGHTGITVIDRPWVRSETTAGSTMSDDDVDSVFTSADIEDFGGGCDTTLYAIL